MEAGKLDRRITLERFGTTYNEFNEPIEGWAEVGKRWASKKDASDGEKLRAAQLGGTVTTRFVVRYDSLTKTISSADRIVYDGKVYSISGVKETEGRKDGIELTCSTSTDNLVTP